MYLGTVTWNIFQTKNLDFLDEFIFELEIRISEEKQSHFQGTLSGTTSDITENFDDVATIQPANVLRHSAMEHFPNQTPGFFK